MEVLEQIELILVETARSTFVLASAAATRLTHSHTGTSRKGRRVLLGLWVEANRSEVSGGPFCF